MSGAGWGRLRAGGTLGAESSPGNRHRYPGLAGCPSLGISAGAQAQAPDGAAADTVSTRSQALPLGSGNLCRWLLTDTEVS